MDKGIARAFGNIAIFLEFSSASVINDDASVGAMEQLAADLQALDEQTRFDLAAAFRAVSTNYDAELREFIVTLPEALGLE